MRASSINDTNITCAQSTLSALFIMTLLSTIRWVRKIRAVSFGIMMHNLQIKDGSMKLQNISLLCAGLFTLSFSLYAQPRQNTLPLFPLQEKQGLKSAGYDEFIACLKQIEYQPSIHDQLIAAAYSDNINQAKALIAQGADVNYQSKDPCKYKTTALMAASIGYQHNLAKWLVEQGANIETVDANLRTALHYAASWNNLRLVQFFVQKKAWIQIISHQRQNTLNMVLPPYMMQLSVKT